MAAIKILGKTIDAFQLLRQPQNDLPKEARTLLLLVDGKRHIKELRLIATANGVRSFDDAVAYLEEAGLVQELPDSDEDALLLDDHGPVVPPTNLITLDFAVPPGALDKPPAAAPAPKRNAQAAAPTGARAPTAAAASPAPAASAPAEPAPPASTRDDVKARLVELLRPRVEEALRAKLLPEVRATLQKEMSARLEQVLRPHVERQLALRIHAEMKPRLEREFKERLEAALAARLKATPGLGSFGDADASVPDRQLALALDEDAPQLVLALDGDAVDGAIILDGPEPELTLDDHRPHILLALARDGEPAPAGT
jgi:hypothetical protein